MSEAKLAGKVALVTGSSRGIGRAIAGGQAIAVQADFGKTADVQRLFDQTIAQFGKVDSLCV